ncbi:MAG TPA: HlyD family efflux transporter periplasmic adaptor subunit [Blastocatellia bacterium]|nr:HlyD family efflux transporter periplasmic adaptor subunit [Blastocatellia bacterium]HMV86472.1 HlyD family efflux transporter periplasmic adaptor subunit [Blastocatellia bacterium]HMY74008.1 HlyD family efflux transporter periplasmic adaptor subunit [Blastocatellia bacterium]HMZ18351.1 HlyD family efflux transporter periplasmic adaptor subunit [Blastocatellia bacterium]HNG31722.1 HlyD family efflux transporter periplasmic adaptor subunit [Blastocatellia bacterium]
MDKPRDKSVARNRKIRRIVYIVLTLGAIGAISVALARLKPAAQTVERSTVIIDPVKQGEMIRNVKGLGTLVPENIVWIPAVTSGRVEKRLVQPGTTVTPDTVIFEMSNQELQQQLQDSELQYKSAEAEYNNRKVDLETQLLNQRAAAATVESDYQQARQEAEANQTLNKEGLVSDLVLKRTKIRAEELATRNELEKKRIAMTTEAMKTQLAVTQSTLDQRKALVELRRKQVADLRVRAGMHGVLQQLAVEVGQQVTQGTQLARVSDPTKLKAQVRIAETQLKDIRIGLPATIDTRNGIIPGRVIRVDPAATNGTVVVDVSLEGALPQGARPDMSVDGTIELERLPSVLKIQRPAFGQEKSTIKLFKLEADDQHAEAVTVQLGRQSVTEIEIVGGLKVGDKVIVSDTSQLGDNVTRIRLN